MKQKLNEINYKVGHGLGEGREGHNETITKHSKEKETNNKTNRCDWISVNNANEFRLESLARVYPRFLHLYIRRICACHPTHTSRQSHTHNKHIYASSTMMKAMRKLNGCSVSRKAAVAVRQRTQRDGSDS